MHRLAALLTLASLGACGRGGSRAGTEAPSARAPELVEVAGCNDATLRAFDPGLPGREIVAVEERPSPADQLTREHARTCEPAEDDALCVERARSDVLAADPGATVGHASIQGEPVGWQAQLEVDGRPVELRVPDEADVIAEARRLRGLGHRVVPIEGRRVFRVDGRRALVSYQVRVASTPARLHWQADLRWPRPADVPAAMERLHQEAERAELVVFRVEVVDDDVHVVVGCR